MARSTLFVTMMMALSAPSIAQQSALPSGIIDSERPVERVVDPIPYWVDVSKLRIREDPFAGKALGSLEWGKQVAVYEQLDNWMRISPPGKNEQWINGDYVSDKRLTWTTYNVNARRNATLSVNDIDISRVKYKGEDARIYAFNKLALSPEKRMVDTRHDLDTGSYYKRYVVQCTGHASASHSRLVGEGYTYVKMYEDPRNLNRLEDFDDSHAIGGSNNISEGQKAIAKFACGSRS